MMHPKHIKYYKHFKHLSLLNISLWILLGLIPISSTIYGYNHLNVVVSVIFLIIAFFGFLKYRSIKKVVRTYHNSNLSDLSFEGALRNALKMEGILILISALLALVMVFAAGSRFLMESMSVFG